MKTFRSIVPAAVFSLLISMSLFSFTTHKGGEGFEIYLNSKLIVQQFGSQISNLKSIQLDRSSLNDELVIKYFHCGQAGKNRSITIKDDKNKILKEWHFDDGSKTGAAMTCKVKDIVSLKKGNGTFTLNLFYSSTELPKGRQLASLVLNPANMAKL